MGVLEPPDVYDSQKGTIDEGEAPGLPPRQHAKSIYLRSGFGQQGLKHTAHQMFMFKKKKRAKHVPEYSA